MKKTELNSTEVAVNMRISALTMVSAGGSSHIGSALSCTDIVAVLYARIMRYSVEDPKDPHRDRFILSKGHAGVCFYAALAEVGFFPKAELSKHYQNGSFFSGHVSHKGIPGVELSTGSLGHGLPVGVGMALAAKLDQRDSRVFVLLGDGELMEGANWEALLFAAHHNLDNLTVIVDRNHLQSIRPTEETVALEPIGDKFAAFGWSVKEVDGHDHEQLAVALSGDHDNPEAVIAQTTKGKGVSFMENRVDWHYKSPDAEQLQRAVEELKAPR